VATLAARSNSPSKQSHSTSSHEAPWRLALQADYALGLRDSITRRYDDLAHALDEQLGLQPTRETRVMYPQLLGAVSTDGWRWESCRRPDGHSGMRASRPRSKSAMRRLRAWGALRVPGTGNQDSGRA